MNYDYKKDLCDILTWKDADIKTVKLEYYFSCNQYSIRYGMIVMEYPVITLTTEEVFEINLFIAKLEMMYNSEDKKRYSELSEEKQTAVRLIL